MWIFAHLVNHTDEQTEQLHEENLLKAKRKMMEKYIYEEDEVTGAEEMIIKSTQYSTEVE